MIAFLKNISLIKTNQLAWLSIATVVLVSCSVQTIKQQNVVQSEFNSLDW